MAFKTITLAALRKFERDLYLCYATRAFNYATLTVLLWDMVLTMQREVEVVWSARWTITKSLYLINRYVTPFFVIMHIWAFSGQSRGLSDTTCRVIYSVSSVAAIVTVSFVSLVVIIRLYAVYELSSRTFFLFLFYWFFTLLAFGGLTIPALWNRLDRMRYNPAFNVCIFKFSPTFWTILLPVVIEHGILFIFLIKNAMNTPKSCQSAALATVYRGGVLFYGFTFSILLSAMITWRFFGSLSSTAFTVGLFLTMATTRLLLHIKPPRKRTGPSSGSRSQMDIGPGVDHSGIIGDNALPFTFTSKLSEPPVAYRISDSTRTVPRSGIVQRFVEERNHSPSSSISSFSSSSKNNQFRILNLGRRSVQVEQTLIRQRAWWLFGTEYVPVETRVIIDRQYEEELADGATTKMDNRLTVSEDRSVLGSSYKYSRGISVSRLGWFDHWL
ncbi:hypothetical protein FRB91_001717 [Serendipita sp. 411]|nr:hypothetical protein FRB91_001717 [Serendipita sp. 411]